MGQYWIPVNLDKREYIHPHKLGSGLKLWEQLASSPGVGAALIILTAAMPEARGGGDLDLDENWHGPERPATSRGPGKMPGDYPTIARRTIGRWAGDRIAIVGDYAKRDDLAAEHRADHIYRLFSSPDDFDPSDYNTDDVPITREDLYLDVTDDVACVLEHEMNGKFVGGGWRTWQKETA